MLSDPFAEHLGQEGRKWNTTRGLRSPDPHAEQSGPARDEIDRLPFAGDAARLPDDGRVPCEMAVLGQPSRAAQRAGLLVGGEHKPQAPEPRTGTGERDAGEDHPGHRAFHVSRAEPPELAVLRHRVPGVVLPGVEVAGGLRVEMPGEQECPPAPGADLGDHVRPVRLVGKHPDVGDSVAHELLLDEEGDGALIARRVDARRRHERAGELQQLVLEAVQRLEDLELEPVELRRRHRQAPASADARDRRCVLRRARPPARATLSPPCSASPSRLLARS